MAVRGYVSCALGSLYEAPINPLRVADVAGRLFRMRCPYAAGATGNVATEEVVYLLHEMGHRTGVELDRLLEADRFICAAVGSDTSSLVA